jgi:hypothetical protein
VPPAGGGVVAGQLGVDPLVAGAPVRDEGVQQPPPQVGVHGEAVERRRGVEQSGEEGELLVAEDR